MYSFTAGMKVNEACEVNVDGSTEFPNDCFDFKNPLSASSLC